MVFESKLFFASKFFSHGHRKHSHLAKCPAAPFAAQWHLCGFTSTSYLPAVPNTLSLWRHRAWPIFRSGHFSILPRKDSSSSFSSLCTFSRTWAVLQCTDEMREEPEIFPSRPSSTFVTTAVSKCNLSFSGWCFLSCLQVLAVVEGAVLHFRSPALQFYDYTVAVKCFQFLFVGVLQSTVVIGGISWTCFLMCQERKRKFMHDADKDNSLLEQNFWYFFFLTT